MLLSLVLPCYNEEAVLEETHRQLDALTKQWLESGAITDFEIIFVNDGSRDRTLAMLRQLADQNPRIRVVSFSGNYGHQAAILAGMHHARGDAVVTLDADLQDPPETITEMLEKVREGCDIVYGVRRSRTKDTVFKRTTAQAYYKLLHAMGVPVVYDHADFRMITRPVCDALNEFQERALFLRGIFPIMGFKSATVAYERPERFAGETKYPLRKMLLLAVNGITSFAYLPLRFAFFIGMLVFILSLGLSVWALWAWLLGETQWGWASTVIPIYLLGGLQMMFIGILGEYIGKIFQETKRRPRYIVRELLNFDAQRAG